jgi:hypothetical protein
MPSTGSFVVDVAVISVSVVVEVNVDTVAVLVTDVPDCVVVVSGSIVAVVTDTVVLLNDILVWVRVDCVAVVRMSASHVLILLRQRQVPSLFRQARRDNVLQQAMSHLDTVGVCRLVFVVFATEACVAVFVDIVVWLGAEALVRLAV